MNVLVLTGAGISAESGIPTFRGSDGLWEGHRVEEVATPGAFDRDPKLVHHFYNLRRSRLQDDDIRPNLAHVALAEFEAQHDGEFLLVTQNIDDLHQRAGSSNVLAMHGELLKARCLDTGERFEWRDDLGIDAPHPKHPDDPSRAGRLRPDVVWFGEMPIGLERIQRAAEQADLFIAIGTSSVVYPAAGIVQSTRAACQKIEINLDDTPQTMAFDQSIHGKASVELPKFLASLTA